MGFAGAGVLTEAEVCLGRQKASTLPGSQMWASQEGVMAFTGALGSESADRPVRGRTGRRRRQIKADRNMGKGTAGRSGISNYMEIIIIVKII